MIDLSGIEQAIKDAIKSLNRSYLKEIKTYGGDFDEDLDGTVRRLPAVWTTFEGSGARENLTARKYKMKLKFVVLVGARSIRTEETARHGVSVDGDKVNVGSFDLLEDISAALEGQTFKELGLSLLPLECGKISTIFNTKTRGQAISVLSQEVTTVITVSIQDREDIDADLLKRINVNYLLEPQDDVPDAADLVELRP